MKLSKLFGKRLKQIRQEKGITQQELAELCELHTTTIGMIEIGKRSPSLATIELLADKLKINYSEFFNFDYSTNTFNDKELKAQIDKEINTLSPKILKYLIEHVKSIKKLFD